MTPQRNAIEIKLPTWLLLAVVLLLIAQTVQFGMLFALLQGDGSASAVPPEPVVHVADMEPSSKRLELRDPAEVAAVLDAPDVEEDADLNGDSEAGENDVQPVTRASGDEPARAPAPKKTAAINFEGTTGYLVGPRGKIKSGSVPPGEYRVFLAQAQGSEPTLFESVTLGLGDDVLFRCGFGSCRRIQ
jgi:hypothetical protein